MFNNVITRAPSKQKHCLLHLHTFLPSCPLRDLLTLPCASSGSHKTQYLLSIWHVQVKLTHLIFMPTRSPVMGGEHGARFIVSPHQHILQALHLFNDTLNVQYCHDDWAEYEERMPEEWESERQLWNPWRKLSGNIVIFYGFGPIERYPKVLLTQAHSWLPPPAF